MRHTLAVFALLGACMPLGAITHIRQLLNVAGPGSAPATGYVLIQANRPFRTAGGVAVTTTVFRYDIPASGANTGYLDVNLQPTIGSTATGTTTAPLGYVAEYHTNGIVYRDFWSVPDTGATLALSDIQVNALPATPFALNPSQISDAGAPTIGQALIWNGSQYAPATIGLTGLICTTYTISVSGANWTIATNHGTPVVGPAIAGAITQAVNLFVLASAAEMKSSSLHTTITFSGSSFTSIKATLGDSIGGPTLYTSVPYELTEAASNTNFQKAVLSKSASFAGSTVQLQLTANQNLNSSMLTGSVDVGICISTLP